MEADAALASVTRKIHLSVRCPATPAAQGEEALRPRGGPRRPRASLREKRKRVGESSCPSLQGADGCGEPPAGCARLCTPGPGSPAGRLLLPGAPGLRRSLDETSRRPHRSHATGPCTTPPRTRSGPPPRLAAPLRCLVRQLAQLCAPDTLAPSCAAKVSSGLTRRPCRQALLWARSNWPDLGFGTG